MKNYFNLSLERNFASSFSTKHKEKLFFFIDERVGVWPIGERSCAKAAAMKRDGKSKEEGKNIFWGVYWELVWKIFSALETLWGRSEMTSR